MDLVIYYEKIGFTKDNLMQLVPIERLEIVLLAHLANFPYSSHLLRQASFQHPLLRSLNINDYKKMLTDLDSGYCYQQSLLFQNVLRDLGIEVNFCISIS